MGLKSRNAANQPVGWAKICAKASASWESLPGYCKLVLLYHPGLLNTVVALGGLVHTSTGGGK